MKGSDKWGQGGGPRIRAELVVALLLVVSAAGAYLYYLQGNRLTTEGPAVGVTTVSTTGIQCGDDSTPQVAQQIEQSPDFAALSGGLCYNFNGSGPSGGAAGTEAYYFNHYNGTIAYPCGTAPQDLVDGQIVAVADSTGRVLSLRMANESALNQVPPCAAPPPLGVVSVTDVESTIPAVPQLNLTLTVDQGARSVAGLTANLTLDGGVQTFFFGVTPNAMLAPGQSASSTEIVLGKVSFSAHEVYPLAVWGTFEDGETFSYTATVQIAQVP